MLAQREKVSLNPGESFACREFRTPRFVSPLHFHPECELTLIEASHGLRFVGDSIERFEPGDLVLLGPNLPHYWNNPPDWSGVAHSIVVQFKPDWPGAPGQTAPELAGVARLLRRAGRGLCFSGRPAVIAAARLRRLPGLEPLPRLLLLLETLHDLGEAGAGRPLASVGHAPVFSDADQGRLAKVLDYIDRNAAGVVRQPEAARRAGLSPAAFSRYFRRKLGHTFEEFVNEVRVGRICRALVDQPERTVAEVAFAAGYNNLANFNRQFRRRTGLSPRQYRRRQRLE
ncbi:MAG TPA: AraC family transcriptional regulator [Actinobacteria bacterium]|nr:AraC family transcriptional regulator [Actinomycetota bacterium]